MIEVLSVAAEIYPMVKTGGLADVTAALPGALAEHEVHMRTLVPGYPAVLKALKGAQPVYEWDDLFGGPARLVSGHGEGLDLIVIEAAHLYDRPGTPYAGPDGTEFADNWQRFAALSFVAAELGRGRVEGYLPDILHAHDWQAGLAPAYIAFGGHSTIKTVMTVHNLAFQGQYGAHVFSGLGLPPEAFSMEGVEYYGGVGFLKAGLQCADALTTVSPTYAAEIRTPEFGMGLEGLLNARAGDLFGILNGIDLATWNPDTDPNLEANYRASVSHLRRKNRQALEHRFGLEPAEGPLFAVVSRLTWQKGIDLLTTVIDELVAGGGRLAVLGSGDKHLEDALAEAAEQHPGRVGFVRAYDEPLSHLMQGGADAILIPSRFEPCGLTQLMGLRYGCVPIVARVGGLADTVIDANVVALDQGVATGFQFCPVNAHALSEAIRRALALFADQKAWTRLQRRGMKTEVGWDVSARRYAELYKSLIAG